MSAFLPIATDLLHYGNGRKGPILLQKSFLIIDHEISLL